jgi:putative transposase
MKKSRFTEEQIIAILKEVESGRKTVVQSSRENGVSEATIYKWKQKYGGLEVNEAKRLRELEQENSKLKRMVANLMLEKEAIEEALKKL